MCSRTWVLAEPLTQRGATCAQCLAGKQPPPVLSWGPPTQSLALGALWALVLPIHMVGVGRLGASQAVQSCSAAPAEMLMVPCSGAGATEPGQGSACQHPSE